MTNIQKLRDQLVKKLECLKQTYNYTANKLIKDKVILDYSDLSEQDRGRCYHHLEVIVGNFFRQAMLIVICSYLEESMDLVGKDAISDYLANISIKTNENWFKKRRRLFKEAGVSFDKIEDECERIEDFVVVRNCIVHAGGNIKKYRNTVQVEEAVVRLKERDKGKNLNLVEIIADEFLYLRDNVVSTAINASRKIIRQCCKVMSGKE